MKFYITDKTRQELIDAIHYYKKENMADISMIYKKIWTESILVTPEELQIINKFTDEKTKVEVYEHKKNSANYGK